MPDPASRLSAQLWNIRTSVEAQLRCLSDVQQLVARFNDLALTESRATEKAKIIDHLNAIVKYSTALDVAIIKALREADGLVTG